MPSRIYVCVHLCMRPFVARHCSTFNANGGDEDEQGLDWGGLYREAVNTFVEDVFDPETLNLCIPTPNFTNHIGSSVGDSLSPHVAVEMMLFKCTNLIERRRVCKRMHEVLCSVHICPPAVIHVVLSGCLAQDTFIPNPTMTSPQALGMFEFIGKLMGISIRHKMYLPFRFPSMVWVPIFAPPFE